jgi:polyhydroxybutyrate depolymerase
MNKRVARRAVAWLSTLLLLPCGPLHAQALEERSLQVGAATRWFLVQPPADASRPAAVLVVLHGGGQSMHKIFADNAGGTRGWPALASRENVLLLVPNGVEASSGNPRGDNQTWNDLREGVRRGHDGDDVGFITTLVAWAQDRFNTDRSRVYLTGASNGGMMTMRLLIEAPGPFAAGAAFVASLPEHSTKMAAPPRPTPLMLVHGTLDPLVQWQGGAIAGGRGSVRSAADTVQWWLAANRASTTPVESVLPDADPGDGCTLERREHAALPNPPNSAPVLAITMRGGGHALPSARHPLPDNRLVRRWIGPVCRDAEGTELAWAFLSRHRR